MEEAITGDFALIKALKADKEGNLTFRYKRTFDSLVEKWTNASWIGLDFSKLICHHNGS